MYFVTVVDEFAESFAVMVYAVLEEAVVGVPEITPVIESSDNPVGRAGLTVK